MDKLKLSNSDQARRARVCRKCKEAFLAHNHGERICPICHAKLKRPQQIQTQLYF